MRHTTGQTLWQGLDASHFLSTMQRLPEPSGTSSSFATFLTSLVKPVLCSGVLIWRLNLAVSALEAIGPDALRNSTISCSVTPPEPFPAAGAAAASLCFACIAQEDLVQQEHGRVFMLHGSCGSSVALCPF